MLWLMTGVDLEECVSASTFDFSQSTLVCLSKSGQIQTADLTYVLMTLQVLPSPPNSDVIGYWNKILEVGGVTNPAGRYR